MGSSLSTQNLMRPKNGPLLQVCPDLVYSRHISGHFDTLHISISTDMEGRENHEIKLISLI